MYALYELIVYLKWKIFLWITNVFLWVYPLQNTPHLRVQNILRSCFIFNHLHIVTVSWKPGFERSFFQSQDSAHFNIWSNVSNIWMIFVHNLCVIVWDRKLWSEFRFSYSSKQGYCRSASLCPGLMQCKIRLLKPKFFTICGSSRTFRSSISSDSGVQLNTVDRLRRSRFSKG